MEGLHNSKYLEISKKEHDGEAINFICEETLKPSM